MLCDLLEVLLDSPGAQQPQDGASQGAQPLLVQPPAPYLEASVIVRGRPCHERRVPLVQRTARSNRFVPVPPPFALLQACQSNLGRQPEEHDQIEPRNAIPTEIS